MPKVEHIYELVEGKIESHGLKHQSFERHRCQACNIIRETHHYQDLQNAPQADIHFWTDGDMHNIRFDEPECVPTLKHVAKRYKDAKQS